MSDLGSSGKGPEPVADQAGSGVSLPLIYSLIALAIFAAIGIAIFIVLPFYHRR